MHAFVTKANDILDQLGIIPKMSRVEASHEEQPPSFDLFKKFALKYVKEHNELDRRHPILKQINNFNTIDEIEQILRQNLDYCDDCGVDYQQDTGGPCSDACTDNCGNCHNCLDLFTTMFFTIIIVKGCSQLLSQ